MKIGLLIVCFSICILGCKSKNAIPNEILPPKKMQAVLWDMMRADQFLADYVLNKDTSLKKQAESIKLYQQVLELNNVTKEKFQQSFAFYKGHPNLLQAILDSIVAIPAPTLEIKKPVPVKDSLNNQTDTLAAKDSTVKQKKPTISTH